ncbi:MAG: hypothetical protein II502_00625 [Paludibacteraceae bacterium]|nr:hypothetical protein [Paludibacteraceae bacterium]
MSKYGKAIDEKWLNFLGETMVELSANFYQRVNEIVKDHTETTCIIRDAAVTFENEYQEENNKDYMSKLLEFGEIMVKEIAWQYQEQKGEKNVKILVD